MHQLMENTRRDASKGAKISEKCSNSRFLGGIRHLHSVFRMSELLSYSATGIILPIGLNDRSIHKLSAQINMNKLAFFFL